MNTLVVAEMANKFVSGLEDYVEASKDDMERKQQILSAALLGFRAPSNLRVTPESLDFFDDPEACSTLPTLVEPDEDRPDSPLKYMIPLDELPPHQRAYFMKSTPKSREPAPEQAIQPAPALIVDDEFDKTSETDLIMSQIQMEDMESHESRYVLRNRTGSCMHSYDFSVF